MAANNVDYNGPGVWNIADGQRNIDLDGSIGTADDSGTLSQTFDTIAGQSYLVTFQLSGNPAGGPLVKQVQVSASDSSQTFDYDIQTILPTNLPFDITYEQEEFPFTAVNSSTTLSFASLTYLTGDTGFGPIIDNVSVSAVPEPASMSVVTVAGFGLGLRRRRVKQII